MKSKFLVLLMISTGILAVEVSSAMLMACQKKTGSLTDPENSVRIATFNIRSNYGSDTQDWGTRLKSLDSLFRLYKFDIVGVQEPYQPQIDELMQLHGHTYDYYVVHTGNINSRGVSHSNPVFYRKDRYELLERGVFWFSENPDSVGSVSWEASQARNCVWVQLRDRKTGAVFYVFNSHFDHKSTLARNHSAELLVEKVKKIAGKYPVFCTGDFNTRQTTNAFKTLSSGILMDTYSLAKRVENDNYRTSHGYKKIPPEPGAARIDHIFISTRFRNPKVTLWKVCNEDFDGNWASDHFPVYIEMSWR